MEEYKSVSRYLKKKNKKELITRNTKHYILSFVHKCLLSILLLISTLCIIKAYPDTKNIIEKKVYKENISFAKLDSLYKKYFGSILPVDSLLVKPTQTVFNEKLVYQNAEKYKEGVKLTVDKNYLMPVLESGIVVFMGNKDNYGQTVIVQQVDGIDVWYVNVKNDSIKLYDYVEKGSLLGEVMNNEVYLYYQKKGEFLDYTQYLS